jgi:LemA protein
MDMKWVGIIGVGAVFLLVVFLVLILFVGYNNLVTLDQDTKGKWSEVENQYQRQADLLGNLASIVSSAVSVETNYVTGVTEARTKWMAAKSSGNVSEMDQAGVEMTDSVATFVNAIATNEAYPTLQANKQYTAIMDEVTGTQNRIATARGRYIESVQSYNTTIKQIPNNFMAGMFGYSEKDYFKADVKALQTPQLGTGTLP